MPPPPGYINNERYELRFKSSLSQKAAVYVYTRCDYTATCVSPVFSVDYTSSYSLSVQRANTQVSARRQIGTLNEALTTLTSNMQFRCVCRGSITELHVPCDDSATLVQPVARNRCRTRHPGRVGKYHDIFENIKKYHDIFQKIKISNKLYNNGCNTLMQYLMTVSDQSFVPYVKT